MPETRRTKKISQKSIVSFAADATVVVRFVLKNENYPKHLSSSSKLTNLIFS